MEKREIKKKNEQKQIIERNKHAHFPYLQKAWINKFQLKEQALPFH